MNFNSLAFLIYLPTVLAVCWILPFRFRKYWLLAASYFFYMYWNPLLIFLLLFSTAVDYCCAAGIEKRRDRKGICRLLLSVSLFMNLGVLFFFKYWNFFGETMNALYRLFGVPFQVPELDLILPVGISFYTFQTMSYTIDVYRGKAKAERDPVLFALFVTYFPQLVAGPIESASDLIPQLAEEHHLSASDFRMGMQELLSGFFRKCVVADCLGIYVTRVFNAAETANALAVFLAGALFCFQMYCDFAGYSEIAMGCARLMGVRLTRNFRQPYLSVSYTDFFRRWHISLNRWFTQYVYIPLGGSRCSPAKRIRNILIVFLLCGLWHGARWTYVLWGLYAALWLCLESRFLKPVLAWFAARGIREENRIFKWARRAVMFLIYIPAALLFRAGSLSEAGTMLSHLFTGWGAGLSFGKAAFACLGMDLSGFIRVSFSLICMGLICPLTYEEEEGGRTLGVCGWVIMILAVAAAWISLLSTEGNAAFAYFQF